MKELELTSNAALTDAVYETALNGSFLEVKLVAGSVGDDEPRGIQPEYGLSGNFWLVSFKISYLCLPLFYETRTTPSCHPSGCAYRQL